MAQQEGNVELRGNPEDNGGNNINAGVNQNNIGENDGQGNDILQQNMADPLPHLPVLHNLPNALKLIRKYDGRSNVKEWISKFETDLLSFGIPYKYACLSLDRFFVEDASNWWSSVCHSYDFDPSKNEDLFKQTWELVVRDLKAFFDHSALKEIHKIKNKSITFKVGDDPQQYVTQKLATLKEIDQHMAEDRKLDQLLKGLPSQIRLQFSSQELTSVSQFLNRLRKYSQILMESQNTKSPSSQSNSRAFLTPSSTHATTSLDALHALQQPQQPSITCYACNQVGHIQRDCPRFNSFLQQTSRYPNTQLPQPSRYFYNNFYRPRPRYYQAPQNFNNYNSRFRQSRTYTPINRQAFTPHEAPRNSPPKNQALQQISDGDVPQSQNIPASEN